MRPTNDCFVSGADYATCMAAIQNSPGDRWAIPVSYDPDSEANPFVVGGAAWRALHPEAAAVLDASRAAQAQAANPIVVQGVALPEQGQQAISGPGLSVAQTVSASPMVLLLGVLALIALLKR